MGPWSHPSFVNCTRHALIGNIYWNRDWRFIHSLVMATLTLLSVRLQQVLRHLPHATHPVATITPSETDDHVRNGIIDHARTTPPQ